MGSVPETVEDCDRELTEYQKALALVSEGGQVAVWEQIDRVLEIRFLLAPGGGGEVEEPHQYDSEGGETT